MRTGRNQRCPCGSGKKYKHCHLDEDARRVREEAAAEGAAGGVAAAAFPDPRAMERSLIELATALGGGGDGGGAAGGVAGEAQELVYQAFEEGDPERRIELALDALKLHPGCVDALVLLAEEAAGSLAEASELYRKAVTAGENALGERAFREDVGHFWGVLETRPYMRARHGLAQALRHGGRAGEAIEHLEDMLRLNPNDNQGARYALAACLLEEGMDAKAAALLARYDGDGSAAWAYSRALLAFRGGGDFEGSRAALDAAVKANPHVPAFVAGERELPRKMPDAIQLGGESEAVEYAAENLRAWRRTPGAVEWLRTRGGAGNVVPIHGRRGAGTGGAFRK